MNPDTPDTPTPDIDLTPEAEADGPLTERRTVTLGRSPKLVLAFLYPFIATVVGTIGSWIVTGNFNDAEIRTAVAGLLASGLSALGAYVGHPGDVVMRHVD